ncbi:MAG: hypothetical protein V2B15_11180 [Bacteroidota bacterium]
MKRRKEKVKRCGLILVTGIMLVMLAGCDSNKGPDYSGEIQLSSQLFGTENYYLLGYSFEDSEYYKFPLDGEHVPEIINEGYLVMEGPKQVSLPGFNAPGQGSGFALVREFAAGEEARSFFNAYAEVEGELKFTQVSDTVKLHQVWVQRTAGGNYVKMVITVIRQFEVESGRPYNEVNLEYGYAPNGSKVFQVLPD